MRGPVLPPPRPEEVWHQRAERAVRDARVGPVSLLEEKSHALVRTEMRRTRKRRRLAAAVCVAVPLLVFLGSLFLDIRIRTSPFYNEVTIWHNAAPALSTALGAFVCLWPLVMFTGAALTTAMSVISERTRYTAFQLVLTPLPGSTIAAAKVLPRVGPFILGIVAAAPLYCWAGGWEPLTAGGHGLTPLAFWPLRLAALGWAGEPVRPSLGGGICGMFMVAADAGMVWAAAHWGACYAVWLGNLPGVILYLLWRLLYLAVVFPVWYLPSLLCILPTSGPGTVELAALFMLPAAAYLLLLLWLFPMRKAVRLTLVEFASFDRLAEDDFRPGYFKRFRFRPRSQGPPRS